LTLLNCSIVALTALTDGTLHSLRVYASEIGLKMTWTFSAKSAQVNKTENTQSMRSILSFAHSR
jgi:hypothetical protein